MSTTPPPPLQQTTNDRGVCEQTTVPGCAQTTLAALAKRQFGGLKRHLCHTLELGRQAIACAITFSYFFNTARTFMHVTCRPLITSLNSFTRVCKSIIDIKL